MGNNSTWGRQPGTNPPPDHRHQNDRDSGHEVPGDTEAPDIVGRTGEEMPEVAHDNGPDHFDDQDSSS